MTKRDDGGPAFPSHGTMCEVLQEGISLRDYFAAKAMVFGWNDALGGEPSDIKQLRLNAAKQAYAMADAMLKARKA